MSYKISVILPTKNNSRTIKKCLDSIFSQTYKNFELIVVDNFSDDWTYEILHYYDNKYDNMKLFQKWPERNIQRPYWFSKSSWEIVYFIDSDMYLDGFLLEEINERFTKNRDLCALIVPEINFDAWWYWTKVKKFERSFYQWDDQIEAARVFKREIYEKVGGYDKNLIAWEDWDLSERVKALGCPIMRTEVTVIHDEWKVELFKLLKKKYYYGWQLTKKSEKHWIWAIISKNYFFRPIYYKKFYKFLLHPFLWVWFVILIFLQTFVMWVAFIKNMLFNRK